MHGTVHKGLWLTYTLYRTILVWTKFGPGHWSVASKYVRIYKLNTMGSL